jgi:hypothetical protein
MLLLDYIKQQRITFGAFAKLIDVSTPRAVQRYTTGERIPHPEIMKRIFNETGGLVTATDFYNTQSSKPSRENSSRRVSSKSKVTRAA